MRWATRRSGLSTPPLPSVEQRWCFFFASVSREPSDSARP